MTQLTMTSVLSAVLFVSACSFSDGTPASGEVKVVDHAVEALQGSFAGGPAGELKPDPYHSANWAGPTQSPDPFHSPHWQGPTDEEANWAGPTDEEASWAGPTGAND